MYSHFVGFMHYISHNSVVNYMFFFHFFAVLMEKKVWHLSYHMGDQMIVNFAVINI